uniref:Uncharacterized protein n=1 Tax=Salmonella phage vB_SEnST11_KE23 TaxID=3161174 RepID=A0AAU8GG24_9CAUD
MISGVAVLSLMRRAAITPAHKIRVSHENFKYVTSA